MKKRRAGTSEPRAGGAIRGAFTGFLVDGLYTHPLSLVSIQALA